MRGASSPSAALSGFHGKRGSRLRLPAATLRSRCATEAHLAGTHLGFETQGNFLLQKVPRVGAVASVAFAHSREMGPLWPIKRAGHGSRRPSHRSAANITGGETGALPLSLERALLDCGGRALYPETVREGRAMLGAVRMRERPTHEILETATRQNDVFLVHVLGSSGPVSRGGPCGICAAGGSTALGRWRTPVLP